MTGTINLHAVRVAGSVCRRDDYSIPCEICTTSVLRPDAGGYAILRFGLNENCISESHTRLIAVGNNTGSFPRLTRVRRFRDNDDDCGTRSRE